MFTEMFGGNVLHAVVVGCRKPEQSRGRAPAEMTARTAPDDVMEGTNLSTVTAQPKPDTGGRHHHHRQDCKSKLAATTGWDFSLKVKKSGPPSPKSLTRVAFCRGIHVNMG